jgi:hypothetical protein
MRFVTWDFACHIMPLTSQSSECSIRCTVFCLKQKSRFREEAHRLYAPAHPPAFLGCVYCLGTPGFVLVGQFLYPLFRHSQTIRTFDM